MGKKRTGAKITRKMQTDMTGVNGADPAENQTLSYSTEVELEGYEVNPWPYIHALLCSVSCVCLGRPNLQHLDIALRKHVEVR